MRLRLKTDKLCEDSSSPRRNGGTESPIMGFVLRIVAKHILQTKVIERYLSILFVTYHLTASMQLQQKCRKELSDIVPIGRKIDLEQQVQDKEGRRDRVVHFQKIQEYRLGIGAMQCNLHASTLAPVHGLVAKTLPIRGSR